MSIKFTESLTLYVCTHVIDIDNMTRLLSFRDELDVSNAIHLNDVNKMIVFLIILEASILYWYVGEKIIYTKIWIFNPISF